MVAIDNSDYSEYNTLCWTRSALRSMVVKIDLPPQPVGYWKLPGSDGNMSIRFAGWKRPRWLTRNMMWLIFEWKWNDA